LILAAIIGGVFAYKQAMRSENFRLWQDGIFLKIPVFGLLYNKIIITRFARTFASLSRSGVPICRVWPLSAGRRAVCRRPKF
jgi:type IV pilus assembly protein PilC